MSRWVGIHLRVVFREFKVGSAFKELSIKEGIIGITCSDQVSFCEPSKMVFINASHFNIVPMPHNHVHLIDPSITSAVPILIHRTTPETHHCRR